MCTKAVAVNVRVMSDQLQGAAAQPAWGADRDQGDILPTDLAPVITHDQPRVIQYMRWGLVPSFATDLKQLTPMFNARAETLTELRSFRDLIMTRRCLILNEGFYENETIGQEKVQWKISPQGEDLFYKAGLWTTWRNPHSGEVLQSFTMITCDPAGHPFSQIHNRMPIILNKAERRLWMHPQATKEQLLGLLKPCPEAMYQVTEHSRKPAKAGKAGKGSKSDPDKLF